MYKVFTKNEDDRFEMIKQETNIALVAYFWKFVYSFKYDFVEIVK